MSTNAGVYPCDRDMPNGPRGLHDYVTYPGSLPTCRLCGRSLGVEPHRTGFDRTPFNRWD